MASIPPFSKAATEDYVIDRMRTGVLQQFTVDLVTQTGVGARLHREGTDLTGGKAIYVYGQNVVVKHLMWARIGRPVHYEAPNFSVHNIDLAKPTICYVANGNQEEVTCDFIAGCDSFHGIRRPH